MKDSQHPRLKNPEKEKPSTSTSAPASDSTSNQGITENVETDACNAADSSSQDANQNSASVSHTETQDSTGRQSIISPPGDIKSQSILLSPVEGD